MKPRCRPSAGPAAAGLAVPVVLRLGAAVALAALMIAGREAALADRVDPADRVAALAGRAALADLDRRQSR
jgi:hypothetical protein